MAVSEERLFSGFAILYGCCGARAVKGPTLAWGTAFRSNSGFHCLVFWGNQAVFRFQRWFKLYGWPSFREILFFLRHPAVRTSGGRIRVGRIVLAFF